MALGYFPAVPILLLLESAKITGEATTQVTTFPPTSVPTSEPHHFTSVSDTTGGMETTTPALGTTKFLPSSMALLSDPNHPWSTLGEKSTPDDTAVSSLAVTSIPSATFGGPSKEGVSLPSESTMRLIRSTMQEMNSSSQPPTPREKMTSEGPLTTISTTSPAEIPSEKHASSLPLTTETVTTYPLSFPLLTSTLVTSTPRSATSEVSTASLITRWWPGSSLFPTYSSVTQDESTPKVTSTGLLPSTSPAGTPEVTVSSSSLHPMSSIPSTAFGGPSEEGSTQPTVSTVLIVSSTIPHSPTPQDKMTSEGRSATISTRSQAETTREKHVSSPPITAETTVPLPTSSLATSRRPSGSTGVGHTTGSSEVTTASEAEITSWWPGSSLSSTYSSVAQDRSTQKVTSPGLLSSNPGRSSLGLSTPSSTAPSSESPATPLKTISSTTISTLASKSLSSTRVTQDGSTPKVTSTGLLSSNPGRTSLGLSAPSSTNPTSEFPAATVAVVPSIPTSPSASTSLREIAGEATTQVTTSPTSVPTPQPHHFTSVSDTTGATETTTPAVGTTESLPSSVVLLSDATRPWSTLGETSLPGTATTLFSSSSPEGSTPAGTPEVTVSSSSLHPMSSIPSTAFGGPSEEGSTQLTVSTVLIVRSTIPHSPTPQDKMTSEGLSATISTRSQAETTREKHVSSPPITDETTKTSPLSVPLPTSSLATSRRPSGSTGVGHTTGSLEVTTASEAEITSWWPGSSLSSTYSSVAQDRSTRKVTSPGLLSSNPGRSSLGLSTPSSTAPSSENPATPLKLLSSTTISTSSSKSLSSTRGEATTQVTTSPPTSVPTSEPHHFTSVSDTTGGMETTTPALGTTKFLPSSVALLSDPNRPWSTLGERSTPDDTAASSLAMTSIPSASFGGPSKEGVSLPSESTMRLIRSTMQEMNSSSHPPTPQEKMTSEGPLTTISTTSPAETPSEKHASSLPLTTETITTSPLSFPLLTSTLVTSTPTSATSGLGDTTGSSEISTASEAPITRWWPGSSLFPRYSSVTQDGSTPKVMSVGPLSSNPGRSSLGPSGPSSTNPTKQSPGTTLKALSPISPSPSAAEGLSQAPARNRFILSVRFSTTLNIADLSVRGAMLKWLDHELQAKFPVGSFHLTWVG